MTQCVCFSLPWHAVDVILLLLVVLATRCVASNVMPQATMASHSLLVVVALAAVTLATARDTPAAPTEAAAASGMAIQCDSFDYCRACIANGCGWCGHSTYAIHVLWQRTVDHRCSRSLSCTPHRLSLTPLPAPRVAVMQAVPLAPQVAPHANLLQSGALPTARARHAQT